MEHLSTHQRIAIRVAAAERGRDRSKRKKPKGRKVVDSSTAASAHLGLLERYKDFHETGANLLGFRGMVDDLPADVGGAEVIAAQKECAEAFNELDAALKRARSSYSHLMAALAAY
jgi:cephalosporin hydroxylase